jgi:S-adenosylmethionine:tRNA ribosyltransferase-isomerase
MFEGAVPSGERLATQRLGAASRLRIVDAILSGTHARGTSHYELLRAFVDDEMLGRVDQELNARYRTHEFGDSVFLERADNQMHSVEQPDGGERLSHGEISPAQSACPEKGK